MIYPYYTYKSSQAFIADINSYLKLCGWSDFINTELRIKLEPDGKFKVSKGLIQAWSIFYWFEGTIQDKERYTDVLLKFRLSLSLKALILFQVFAVIAAFVVGIFIQPSVEHLCAPIVFSLFIAFEAYIINLDKFRIKNSFAKSFELIEGPF